MVKKEVGKVIKNNIALVEYEQEEQLIGAKFFVQVGIAGFYCTKKELQDLYAVLNYYCNIEYFSECIIKVEDEHVAIR